MLFCKLDISETMNKYKFFDELRYHHENEVAEFKKAENNFNFDDLGKYFASLRIMLISVQIQY